MNIISSFRGEHRFLSNFHPSPIKVRGVGLHETTVAPTGEHLFQAMKTLDRQEQQQILDCDTPSQAKHMGRKVTLRSDWEDIKLNVMMMVVHAKFEQNLALRELLIDTNDSILIEGNEWGDTEWGCVLRIEAEQPGWEGHNRLGKILMKVRSLYSK